MFWVDLWSHFQLRHHAVVVAGAGHVPALSVPARVGPCRAKSHRFRATVYAIERERGAIFKLGPLVAAPGPHSAEHQHKQQKRGISPFLVLQPGESPG